MLIDEAFQFFRELFLEFSGADRDLEDGICMERSSVAAGVFLDRLVTSANA